MVSSVRNRRKQLQRRLGLVLIGGVLLVLFAFGVLSFKVKQEEIPIDEETLCPVEGPKTLTVVLMDRTDPLSLTQQKDLRSKLEKIKEEIPLYGGIAAYSVGPIGKELLHPETKLVCNPGRGKDINPLIGNPRIVERKWRERFSEPLERLFDELLKTEEASTSPIMESIQSVSLTALRGLNVSRIPRRLVIVSDMLQHTNDYSQYTMVQSFQDFKKEKAQYYSHMRTDLGGVEITVFYVQRDTRRNVQQKQHIEFWQEYFGNMGGILTDVKKLEG